MRPPSACSLPLARPGLRVPEDLSVLGFDDIVEASYVGVGLSSGVGLSTVRQPLREMGRVAVQRLVRLLADPTDPAVRVILETELVVRQTTARPRAPGRPKARAAPTRQLPAR